jgi:hypothetical protein
VYEPTHTLRTHLTVALLLVAGCKGAGATATDGGKEGGGEVGLPACPAPEPGSSESTADDFGPGAKALQGTSALARVNIYEVTSPHQLERIDIFMRSDMMGTRFTISVYQALSRDSAFQRLKDVQVDVPACEGWASSGLLSLPLQVGRFYAIGFDPNQAITPFVDATASNIPVDGRFGRLIGSKTATSVSIDMVGWDKISDKDFTRQRLVTVTRPADDGDVLPDAGSDGGETGDAVPRDGASDPSGDRG